LNRQGSEQGFAGANDGCSGKEEAARMRRMSSRAAPPS
jgi:hypothetical protein